MAGPASPPSPPKWLPLREELILRQGASGLFGAPGWIVEDPIAHRFFRLGWLEFEVLSRWDMADPEAIARSIAEDTTLHPGADDVVAVLHFAVQNNLVQIQGIEDVGRLIEQKKQAKASWLKSAMKSYLFVRIPLVRPDAFLTRTYPMVAWFFTRRLAIVLAVAILLSLYLIIRQWTQFVDSMAALSSWTGWVMVGLALVFSKVIHELGHGYAAKRMNLHVPAMGVALMCFSPVLWADTTAAWRLQNRKDRLLIGYSGVMAEIMLATAAAWAWLLLPPGDLRTAAFILTSSTWVMTLMINANPLMRFDAYYLLSDFWEAPSLQPRSFALARWYLRRTLFGLADPPPEILPPLWQMRFIIYAYICWVYRFFLFVGIAFLLYYLFFKLLGILLFIIEIAFFIGVPIYKEMQVWWTRRADIWNASRGRFTICVAALLLLAAAIPWSGTIVAPGLLMAERQTGIYAPQAAVVTTAAVNLHRVDVGKVILGLRSPELEKESTANGLAVKLMEARLANMSLDATSRADFMINLQEYQGLLQDQAIYAQRQAQLSIKAPFAGTLVDVPPWHGAGQWVTSRERIGLLVSDARVVAVYVNERVLSRLAVGDRGFFELGGKWTTRAPLEIIAIDTAAVTELQYPELASSHGGPIGVLPRPDRRLVPEAAVYKILCRIPEQDVPTQSLVGVASLHGKPKSILAAMWQNLLGIIVRESGL